MEPTLIDGDIVFYKKINLNKTQLKIGDIVIFDHPLKEIKLIKRVINIKRFGIEVAGDNKKYSDDSKFFGLIDKNSIIGIVTSHINLHA